MAVFATRPRQALTSLFVGVLAAVALVACSGGSTADSSGNGSPAGSGVNGTVATDTVVGLSWQPNADAVSGYLVYYGPAPEAVNTLAVQMSLASNTFDAQAPRASFNAGLDLGLQHGDSVCFRLRAYNGAGMSGLSPAACGTI